MQNKKLKIVHTESSCGWGGQEIRILTEAKGFLGRGHEVTLLCPEQAPIYEEAQQRNIPVVALPIARKKIKGLLAVRRWLKKNSIDIVNTHSSTDSWLMALASKMVANPPVLVRTRHVSAPVSNNKSTRWLYTKAVKHIATTGEKLKQNLISQNNFPAEMMTSVPTGIDRELFFAGDKQQAREQLNIPQDKKVIGIVATLRSWKGHQYLIDAFAQLNREDAVLLIVGGGPQHDNIEAQIKQLGIENKVIRSGNQRNVTPWMHTMDLFVLPSYANEGVPQGIMQAMMTGLPVVSTPVGSITEAVDHEKNGLIVKPEDVGVLKQAISQFLDDDEMRLKFGEAARVKAEAEFAMEYMLDKMEVIFRQVLA